MLFIYTVQLSCFFVFSLVVLMGGLLLSRAAHFFYFCGIFISTTFHRYRIKIVRAKYKLNILFGSFVLKFYGGVKSVW